MFIHLYHRLSIVIINELFKVVYQKTDYSTCPINSINLTQLNGPLAE